MNIQQNNVPADLYTPAGDPADSYRSLEHQGAEARFKRMDIVAMLYMEELPKGKQGVRERVLKRLELSTETKSSRSVVQDAMRIFTTFRTTGDEGLGYTREQLVVIPYSRLRAVAHHREWALEHRGEVPHLLTLPEEGEHSIRKYIQEAKRQEAIAKGEEPPVSRPAFETRSIRLTAETAALFDRYTAILMQAMEETPDIQLSSHKAMRLGDAVMMALHDWFYAERFLLDENGMPQGGNYMHLLHEAEQNETKEQGETEAA